MRVPPVPPTPVAVWFAYAAALIVGSHWPGLSMDVTGESSLWDLFPLDKVAHVAGFAGLTAITAWAWPIPTWPPPFSRRWGIRQRHAAAAGPSWHTRLAWSAAFAFAWSYVTEHTQQHFAGRTFDPADLVANACGCLGAYVILAPRPTPGRGTAVWVWGARLCVLALTLPLWHYWGTRHGGDEAEAFIKSTGLLEYAHGSDKDMHRALGAALTLGLALARPLGLRRPRASAAFTLAIAGLSAPLMEVVQHRAGRGMDVQDVAAHMHGLLVGLGVWAGLLLTRFAVARADRTADARPGTGDEAPSFVGHAAVVSGLTLVSRVTGLVRDAVLAAAFGLGWVADAFFVAFLIPNLFRRLFGEGALTAAFIPRYTQLLKDDPDAARRFATFCLTALAVLLGAIVLLGEAVLLFASLSIGPGGGERAALTVRLAMIMLPYMPLVCGVAFLGAILQVHGRFGPPAAAPVLLNVTMITAAVLAAMTVRRDGSVDPQAWVAVALAWSVVAAGVLQLGWQSAALSRDFRPTHGSHDLAPHIRQLLKTMGPMLIGLGAFQLNTLLDALIAYVGSPSPSVTDATRGFLGIDSLRYPMQAGDVAALQWAQRLYQFPLGVFGVAIATAIFPALARAAGNAEDFRDTLRKGLRLTVFIGLPATAGLMLTALPLTRLIYERGAFALGDAQRVATILLGYGAAVWAYSMTHTLTRAFYAKDDATTPLRVTLVMVACNLALNLVLIWPLGAAGLAWSTAITAVGQAGALLWLVRRHTDRPVNGFVLDGWLRAAALTLAMAAGVALALHVYPPATMTRTGNALLVAAVVAGAVAVYFAGAWLTKAAELRWLRRG